MVLVLGFQVQSLLVGVAITDSFDSYAVPPRPEKGCRGYLGR